MWVASEGWDLALFVDRDPLRMGRRRHVKPDEILELSGEGQILGALEGAQAMRLELMHLGGSI